MPEIEKKKVSKFLTYEHSSGEVVFVKRTEIASFHPRYIDRANYKIYVTVGPKEFIVHGVESIEAARKWIAEQIALIEASDE